MSLVLLTLSLMSAEGEVKVPVLSGLSDTAMYNTTLAPPKTGLPPNIQPGQ